MATRGRKPKSNVVKLVTGNPGKRKLPDRGDAEVREGPLKPPKRLTKSQKALWTRFIDKAWWLTDHDAMKAYIWCVLQDEFQQAPGEMTAAQLGQLRMFGSELGFDPAARARMGVSAKPPDDPADKFFDPA